MEKIKVKFLKEDELYKKGEVIKMDKDKAEYLIGIKKVVAVEEPQKSQKTVNEFKELVRKSMGGEIPKQVSVKKKNESKKIKKGVKNPVERALDNLERKVGSFFNKKELAQHILEMQPCYYDKVKNWWLWNWSQTKWELVDETDILNAIEKQATVNTINAKEKNEMLEALKQESRKNAPAKIKPTWIQFKNNIYDIDTGEEFRAMPHWFVTNPIPHELNKENFMETPVMDRIFEEWVGEEYVKTLYEIIAYCILPSYPIHRLFCLIGSGLNGKSKFLELLRKFIGIENVCSTELDILLNSRFEITRLHKKLMCQLGETNFNEISKTSILKKLTGGDLIIFE